METNDILEMSGGKRKNVGKLRLKKDKNGKYYITFRGKKYIVAVPKAGEKLDVKSIGEVVKELKKDVRKNAPKRERFDPRSDGIKNTGEPTRQELMNLKINLRNLSEESALKQLRLDKAELDRSRAESEKRDVIEKAAANKDDALKKIYSSYTKNGLLAEAKKLGVKAVSNKNKAEIIELLIKQAKSLSSDELVQARNEAEKDLAKAQQEAARRDGKQARPKADKAQEIDENIADLEESKAEPESKQKESKKKAKLKERIDKKEREIAELNSFIDDFTSDPTQFENSESVDIDSLKNELEEKTRRLYSLKSDYLTAEGLEKDYELLEGAGKESDALTGKQVNEIGTSVDPDFEGTLLVENLADTHKKNENKDRVSYVVNTLSSDSEEGKVGHYIAIIIDNERNEILIMDPLAENPSKELLAEIDKILDRTSDEYQIKINGVQQQNVMSSNCGYHCTLFLKRMADGDKFADATYFTKVDGSHQGEKDAKKFQLKIDKEFEWK